MGSLFRKFQEGVKVLAKSSTFAKNPRQLQFEADINRLFLSTSYNRLGRDADEADIEEIIDMAEKATFADQKVQVQENVHSQIKALCGYMDEILLPDVKHVNESLESGEAKTSQASPRRSGLTLAVGTTGKPSGHTAVSETKPLKRAELSQSLKDLNGYTLVLEPSKIPHQEAGQGLFVDGEADAGSVIAFYPGIVYSPAYYRYIPGYPRVGVHNPYLITRYDGTVINAQPWGIGGETREVWDGLMAPEVRTGVEDNLKGSDKLWKVLSKPLEASRVGNGSEVLERRNPLALAHYANHPAEGMEPNVMLCPYDFPLTEKEMRAYIPNIMFGNAGNVKMKRFGSFWFKSLSSSNTMLDTPVLQTLVLVATKRLCNEEVLLNYRLSNSKRRPAWYTPVDEEEDQRRWS